MVNFKNISDISLNQNEYCILYGNHHYSNSNLKIQIPKLMTNVTSPMRDPFNRNILVNAIECKPSVDNTLHIKNHITVKKSAQCSLAHNVIDEYGTIPNKLGLIALCMNGNYRNMTIIDSI